MLVPFVSLILLLLLFLDISWKIGFLLLLCHHSPSPTPILNLLLVWPPLQAKKTWVGGAVSAGTVGAESEEFQGQTGKEL